MSALQFFRYLNNIPVWLCHLLFISGSMFGSFPCLAFVENTAMNICVQVFVWTSVSISLGYVPESGIAGAVQ